MSIMDSHPHPSIGRGNPAGSTLFEHEVTAKAVIANTSTTSTNIENAAPSPANSHSHHHHHHSTQPHHQFVDSSTVYHHPFRALSPNSAQNNNSNNTNNNKIVDTQPQSKSSTPTRQLQTQSRPSSGSTSEWSVTGLIANPGPQPPSSRRPFSSSANLESSGPRESLPTSVGAGAVYCSPTTPAGSRRSTCHPNSNPPELLPSPLSTTTATAASSYYQHHSGQDPSGLNMIAAINCSGLDVRPMYGSEESRHASSQNANQAHSDIPSPSHTRVPPSEELRGTYYGNPTGSHYSSVGGGMLPSHYPHLSSPITAQPTRRASSSVTGGSAYNPYSALSVSVPVGSGSYGPHHTHHSDGPVVPNWTPSVDSVRDSVSPYSRPNRQPSGAHSAHHASSSAPYAHSLRNGQLLNSQHYPSNPNTSNPHQPGAMQYNAQGRPLAYMCNTCFRAFDRPSALQIHERSHTGERPFPCPWNGCVKRFTTHGNMVKHSRVCPFREPED